MALQAGYQVLGLAVTLFIAIVSGAATGILLFVFSVLIKALI